MERRSLAAGFLVVVLYPAVASSQITSVKILNYPTNAVPLGQAVTFRVEGTPCNGPVNVAWGDGTTETVFDALPFQKPHTYQNPPTLPGSTYTVTASGLGAACRSTATLTFTIAGGRTPGGGGGRRPVPVPGDPIDVLCSQIDCAKVFTDPVIKGGFGKVSQGSFIFVNGAGFWAGPGQLLLHFGAPGAVQTTVKLENLEWSTAAIGASIPDFQGFRDQTAQLQVVRSDGKKSNLWPVPFVAARDVIKLTHNDRSIITSMSCSDESDIDICNGKKDTNVSLDDFFANTDFDAFLNAPCNELICSAHKTGWDPLGADVGTDTYRAELKNGWTFLTLKGSRHPETPGWANINLSGTNTSTMNATIKWNTGGSDERISYAVHATAVGPRGVPYK